jgi:hypothetical protein
MSVALVAPRRAMLRAPGRPVLWRPLRTTNGGSSGADVGSGTGSAPNAIPGLSGWWDASSYANMQDGSSIPLAGWGLRAAGGIIDLSGGQRPATPYRVGSTNTPVATPRLSGTLGGSGYDLQTGPYYPTLDYGLGLQLPDVPMGTSAAWTRFLVWTRPNWKQNPYQADTTASCVLSTNGAPILSVDGSSGAGHLTLFPGSGSAATLSAAMTRRHTHSVIIRNTPGEGVDVWLDGAAAATAVTNPISGQGLATLLVLHGGAAPPNNNAAAQCWFHEAATWERALTATEIAGLAGYATRWALGPRKGVLLTFNGQSNCNNAIYAQVNADLLMAQGLAWYLGAVAYGRASQTQNGSAGTTSPGMGIYYYPEAANPTYAGTFLQDPLDGSDPSGWSIGQMGQEVQNYISGLSTADQGDICALVLWWSETDSYRSYASDWTRFQHAAKRWIQLFRAMLPGATAANMPVIWWNAIPFGNTDGIQMHREVIASLVADPTQNVTMVPLMTADSNDLNDQQNDDGTQVTIAGENQHRAFTDLKIFARRSVPAVARALYATGRNDSLSAIPSGLPVVGGPKITHAYRQSNTTVILTIQHDAGNDLIVPPGQAPLGCGFLVMDGGSVSAPGTLVPASACARVDAAHLQLTLSQALVHPSAQCLLFYPYGSYTPTSAPTYTADMGRGNSVTDNFSQVSKPAGWDIGNDLGSAWDINYPIAATTAPITLSDSPT